MKKFLFLFILSLTVFVAQAQKNTKKTTTTKPQPQTQKKPDTRSPLPPTTNTPPEDESIEKIRLIVSVFGENKFYGKELFYPETGLTAVLQTDTVLFFFKDNPIYPNFDYLDSTLIVQSGKFSIADINLQKIKHEELIESLQKIMLQDLSEEDSGKVFETKTNKELQLMLKQKTTLKKEELKQKTEVSQRISILEYKASYLSKGLGWFRKIRYDRLF